jgi:hypothetical protein
MCTWMDLKPSSHSKTSPDVVFSFRLESATFHSRYFWCNVDYPQYHMTVINNFNRCNDGIISLQNLLYFGKWASLRLVNTLKQSRLCDIVVSVSTNQDLATITQWQRLVPSAERFTQPCSSIHSKWQTVFFNEWAKRIHDGASAKACKNLLALQRNTKIDSVALEAYPLKKQRCRIIQEPKERFSRIRWPFHQD